MSFSARYPFSIGASMTAAVPAAFRPNWTCPDSYASFPTYPFAPGLTISEDPRGDASLPYGSPKTLVNVLLSGATISGSMLGLNPGYPRGIGWTSITPFAPSAVNPVLFERLSIAFDGLSSNTSTSLPVRSPALFTMFSGYCCFTAELPIKLCGCSTSVDLIG
jgi:hypothetical protein